ncbi:MAG: sulfite exporter TauE/SafE family protein, partial [Cyanobacteria bacterium J06642_3]
MSLNFVQLFSDFIVDFQAAIAPIANHFLFDNYFILILLGFGAGLLAGVLGLGGGVVLVPMIKALGYSPVQAVATSSLAIILTSASGSWQNWRMGNLDLRKVIFLALPAIFTAQLGAWAAHHVDPSLLL